MNQFGVKLSRGSGYVLQLVRYSLALLLAATLGIAEGRADSFAYISNCCNGPSTVSVYNAKSNHPSASIEVGTGALSAVFTPDGMFAYVTNNVSRSVSVIQTSNQMVVTTIPIAYLAFRCSLTGRFLNLNSQARLISTTAFSAHRVQSRGAQGANRLQIPRNQVELVRVKLQDSHVTLPPLGANLRHQIKVVKHWRFG